MEQRSIVCEIVINGNGRQTLEHFHNLFVWNCNKLTFLLLTSSRTSSTSTVIWGCGRMYTFHSMVPCMILQPKNLTCTDLGNCKMESTNEHKMSPDIFTSSKVTHSRCLQVSGLTLKLCLCWETSWTTKVSDTHHNHSFCMELNTVTEFRMSSVTSGLKWPNTNKEQTGLWTIRDFNSADHSWLSVTSMKKSLTGKWVTCLCPFNQHSTKHSLIVSCTRPNVSPSPDHHSSHEAGNKSIINQ